MKRIDRYLLRELLPPFAAGSLIFIAVILVNTIVLNSAAIFSLKPPASVILRWLLFRVPIILTFALPVGCLLATSLVVSRLNRDYELLACRLGGVSTWRLFRPLYLFGLAISALSLANNEYGAPYFRTKANEVLVQQIVRMPGAWVKSDMPFRAGDSSVAHVGRVDLKKQELYFVLIYQFRGGRPREAICAPLAVREGHGWVLRDGQHNWFDERGRLLRTERFARQAVQFDPNLATMWDDETEPEHLAAHELARRYRLYHAAGDRPAANRMLYFYNTKFAVPLTCLIFVLLAAPLSLRFTTPGKGNPLSGLSITIAVVFFCNGTINWAKVITLASPDPWLPPIPAAWLHVLVFGLLGLHLARRLQR
ncbi:MAG: LptF/LptG family permease [Fimbriimonadaceae bacterium]|nr:LptF/LptG family permease [Fimbriimonadaceae bacterium]